MEKLRVFVGSSGAQIEPARKLALSLNNEPTPLQATPWKDGGTFKSMRSTLQNLLGELEAAEFGVFVFGPDDLVESNGVESFRTRDNVVFEVGMFLGRLGPERTFIICNRDPLKTLTLPSDLLGITFQSFKFDPKQPLESVFPAAEKIRTAVDEVLAAARPQMRETNVLTEVVVELSNRQVKPPVLKIDRNSGSRVLLRFTNPARGAVKSLDVCFGAEIDVNFMPWRSKLKDQADAVAPDMRYLWLTKEQLAQVTRPHGFQFLLQGRAKGTYEMKIVANVGSQTIVQPVQVEIA